MKIQQQHFLFTGDLEKEGEEELIRDFKNLHVDILKVGHHGSKTSSSLNFISRLKPTEAVISCGRNNRFQHPHIETITTLRKENVTIFQTNINGMIRYDSTIFSPVSCAKIVIK